MKSLFKPLLLTLLFGGPILAEQIQIPVGQQGDASIALPQRGQTMAQVEQTFGVPEQRTTTGKPPISRWSYPKFSVYFESEYVIHSVQTFSRKHPASDN